MFVADACSYVKPAQNDNTAFRHRVASTPAYSPLPPTSSIPDGSNRRRFFFDADCDFYPSIKSVNVRAMGGMRTNLLERRVCVESC